MGTELAAVLAANVRTLRLAMGRTQKEMAKLSGLPRATWANVESGTANPTLAVLHSVAQVLQMPLESLIARPADGIGRIARPDLKTSKRGRAVFASLFSGHGLRFERMELAPGGRTDAITIPRNTVECMAVEAGALEAVAGERSVRGDTGDVLVVQGDQRRTYRHPGEARAVGYLVVFRS